MLIIDQRPDTKCANGRFDLRVQSFIGKIQKFIPEASPYAVFQTPYPGYLPSISQLESDAEMAKILKNSPDLLIQEAVNEVDTTGDTDFNYVAPEQTDFTKGAYGTPSRSKCSKYF